MKPEKSFRRSVLAMALASLLVPSGSAADQVNVTLGDLPAGKTVTIVFQATINTPFTGTSAQVSNQGTVSGTNFSSFLTDDPAVGGAADPTVTVVQLPSATTVVSNANPSVFGQGVSFTATVARSGGTGPTATGSVQFVIDGSSFGSPVTLSGGQAVLTLSTLAVGTHTVSADYGETAQYAASSGSLSGGQVVNEDGTSIAITADPTDPSRYGQAVTVSYGVTANPPGTGTPTGNVTVTDGVDSCTATVAAGGCSITFHTTGSRPLTASYAGDGNFLGSGPSSAEPHTVLGGDTTVSITSDLPDPSLAGQAVAVNYTVSPVAPATGTPTGSVTVSDGVDSCTGTVGGTCTLTLNTAGGRTLTATYLGDIHFNGSTSAGEPHTVNKANTTTAIITELPDPSVTGQPVIVSYTVSVNSPGSGTPTGTVTVTDGTDSCTGTVSAGSCSITFSSVGSKTLTATYLGDTNFNASPASAGVSHTVNKANTTTMITSNTPNPSTSGQAVTVNYMVGVSAPGSGTPTGNVTVTDGVNSCTGTVAAGSCAITFATPGTRTLTATYAGDANFAGSMSPGVSQTVAILGSCAAPVIAVPDGRVTATAIPFGPTAWFGASLSIGHSYSLEFASTLSAGMAPGTAMVFSGDDGCGGTSTVAVRDTTAIAPGEPAGAMRLSFKATGVNPFFRASLANGAGVPYTFSLSDTTRFSAAWSTNGAFDTFYAIENTTGDTVNGTLTLFDLTGAAVTTLSVSIPGGAKANAVTVSLGTPRNKTGTARFTHDGPPGAILIEAAIANFTLANPYVQPVHFDAVRETR